MAILVLFTFLSAFVVLYALLNMFTQTRLRVRQRIEALDPRRPAKEKSTQKNKTRERKPGVASRIRFDFLEKLDGALVRGEIDVSAKDFVVRWAVITAIGAVVAFLFSRWLVGILVIGVSFFGTFLYIRARSTRRLQRFEEGLHDMLTITANSLRAGHSFVQAIQVVSDDMHGPIKEELSRVLTEMSMGMPLEDAFKSAAARMNSADFNLIVTAILIQRQVGGNLSEVLDQISDTIRERVRLKREIKALTAQGRMSGLIFMLLPIGIGIMIYVISPQYISILFQSMIGLTMLGFALVSQIFGFFIIRKIVDIEA